MKDIRLNIGFWDHWKTISLKDRLGLEGVESLQRLWCFAAANKPDGKLTGLSSKALEMACRWTGEPGKFVSTLEELHFIDCIESCYVIHDWQDHNSFVASFPERSKRAKASIEQRWDTKRITECNTKRITPSPSPSPSPKKEILKKETGNLIRR